MFSTRYDLNSRSTCDDSVRCLYIEGSDQRDLAIGIAYRYAIEYSVIAWFTYVDTRQQLR